jgi:hypothetical protein
MKKQQFGMDGGFQGFLTIKTRETQRKGGNRGTLDRADSGEALPFFIGNIPPLTPFLCVFKGF